MTALTIRDVPEDQLQALKGRAAQSGTSLQAYCLDLIARGVSEPTPAEMVTRLNREATAGVSAEDVPAAVDEGRSGR